MRLCERYFGGGVKAVCSHVTPDDMSKSDRRQEVKKSG